MTLEDRFVRTLQTALLGHISLNIFRGHLICPTAAFARRGDPAPPPRAGLHIERVCEQLDRAFRRRVGFRGRSVTSGQSTRTSCGSWMCACWTTAADDSTRTSHAHSTIRTAAKSFRHISWTTLVCLILCRDDPHEQHLWTRGCSDRSILLVRFSAELSDSMERYCRRGDRAPATK